MAQTWKKVKIDGKDAIEVTDTTQTIADRRRVEEEIRHAEHEIAMSAVMKEKAEERLAVLRAQVAVLPAPVAEPVEELVIEP